MSANTILTSVVTGGTNSHTTTAEEANALATDFVTQGVVGAITLNTGSGGTGSFCVNADASADMGVTIKAGQAYLTATPSSQNSQVLRARASADYTAYTINANASGSTKYDWIYLSVDATKANNPAADASDVASFVTSRSSSNTTDNGAPPTYGLLLAIVTVANGASSITNSNITDKRFNTSIGAQNGSLIVTQASTGVAAKVQAAGTDANIDLDIDTKGTGVVKINSTQIGAAAFKNPYKFHVYRSSAWTTATSATVVSFDTKVFDTGTNVDVVTNKGRFTAPVAGFYFFAANVRQTTGTSTPVYIQLFKNGSVALSGTLMQPTVADNAGHVSGMLSLAANDYVEVFWTGGNGSTGGVGQDRTWFQGMLVSAT